MRVTTRPCDANPPGTCESRQKLNAVSADTARMAADNAAWPTTIAFCQRSASGDSVELRDDAISAPDSPVPLLNHAGSAPATSAEMTATPAVANSTLVSR